MNHYLNEAGAAQVQAQIAAKRARLAELRAQRATRHLMIRASCEARAALASLQAGQSKFQIGGAL